MDAIAAALGIDRVEVRRRNLIDKSEMPFERPLHALGDEVVLDSGDYAGPARQGARARSTGRSCKRSSRQRRARRRSWSAPASRCSSRRAGSARRTASRSAVEPSGDVEVVTGGASLGQGFETVMAQICAETLGVDYRRIRVVHGQTDRIEHGIGAHATRATVMTGSATHVAALKVRALALEAAAQLLQTPADDADHRGRPRHAQGRAGGPVAGLGEIAASSRPARASERPRARTRGRGLVHTEHMTYPYGVHVAVVAIDRDTGARQRRALSDRLRRRPRRQSDADRRPARRRLRAGPRRRAVRRNSSTTSAASRSRPRSPTI